MKNLRLNLQVTPGKARARIGISLTDDEYAAWTAEAEACGVKLTKWVPVTINRLLMGIEPINHAHVQEEMQLPSYPKKGKQLK